jgi:hypothetical protein
MSSNYELRYQNAVAKKLEQISILMANPQSKHRINAPIFSGLQYPIEDFQSLLGHLEACDE